MYDRETGFRFSCSVENSEGKGVGIFARQPIAKDYGQHRLQVMPNLIIYIKQIDRS